MKFPCSGCGACCRRVWWIGPEALESHGLSMKEDGSCTNLLSDNSCAIYESRPDICRVDAQADKFDMDTKEYYLENIALCNQWMDEDDMSHLKIIYNDTTKS